MENQDIENNIKARKLAHDLMELGIDLALENNLPPDHIRLYWHFVIDAAASFLNITLVQKEKQRKLEKMSDVEAKKFGKRPFPFGKHAGTPMDEVPLDYLEWYVDTASETVREIKSYLESGRIKSEYEKNR